MKITIDRDRFDALQIRLLEELISSIRNGLKEAGVTDDDTLYEATGNIAFAIAAIVDGSRKMELKGAPVVPILSFAKVRDGDDLIGAEGGSWMHEYVYSTLDDVMYADEDEGYEDYEDDRDDENSDDNDNGDDYDDYDDR